LVPNAEKLIRCYVVDNNHQTYDGLGNVTYSGNNRSTVFSGSPTLPGVLTVVGDDNSTDSKICLGSHKNPFGGVHIDACSSTAASNSQGSARRLAECYVVYYKNKVLTLEEGIVHYNNNGTWTARLAKPIPAGECTWTVVGTNDSIHACHSKP
jgi:hypothetical protein